MRAATLDHADDAGAVGEHDLDRQAIVTLRIDAELGRDDEQLVDRLLYLARARCHPALPGGAFRGRARGAPTRRWRGPQDGPSGAGPRRPAFEGAERRREIVGPVPVLAWEVELEPLAQERLHRVFEERPQVGEVDHDVLVRGRRKRPVDEPTLLAGSLLVCTCAGERAGVKAPGTRTVQLVGPETAVVERLEGVNGLDLGSGRCSDSEAQAWRR